MIFVVDERAAVKDGFVSLFDRIGVSAAGLCAGDCRNWIESAASTEIGAVEAVLVGECGERGPLSRAIRERSHAAVIAVNDEKSLVDTLDLFEAGYDDVVRKPIHVSEILARIKAIRRRAHANVDFSVIGSLKIYSYGRDPEIDGVPFSLPRRERRILEYLITNKDCWMTKTQIFNCVYGLFRDEIDETVIECHISKLRKRLRAGLGYDPIHSQRYFGYRFEGR